MHNKSCGHYEFTWCAQNDAIHMNTCLKSFTLLIYSHVTNVLVKIKVAFSIHQHYDFHIPAWSPVSDSHQLV